MGSQRVGHNWATFTHAHVGFMVWGLFYRQENCNLQRWVCSGYYNISDLFRGRAEPRIWSSDLLKVKVKSLSHVRLFVDCSPPGSSVHGIFQARVSEWVAISFFRGSSRPRDQAWVSRIADRRFTIWATRDVSDLLVNICIVGSGLPRWCQWTPAASAGDLRDTGSIPGSERSPGEGHGNPLQYSCLENPLDRGAWWATVHGFAKIGHN